MPCPVCGYANPEGTRQCAACGTQLIKDAAPAARLGDATCATHKDQPALAPCGRCGTFYCGACLERSPDGNLYCVQCRQRSSLPWDQRDQLGMARAWFLTCKALLLEPTQTLSTAPRDAGVGSSLLFTLICSVVGYVPTLMLSMVGFGGVIVAAAQSTKATGGSELGVGMVTMVFIFVFYTLISVGIQVVALFVLAGIEHLVLQLSGERELGSYTVSVRAHALGLAPMIIGVLPGCGVMVMGLWSLVLRCITLMSLQRVSAGKAVVAVVAPVVVICGCGMAFYFFLIAAVVSAAGLR